MAWVLAALTVLPTASPALGLFALPSDPFSSSSPGASGAAVPAALALAPGPVASPLVEAYRTSLLGPDVTRVLEARAQALGLPIVEVAWTHDTSGERPLREALLALAAADAPGLRLADLEPALAEADALPRDLQEALARLVWRIVDASDLQREAFAPLTAAERDALWSLREDDAGSLATAIVKVDVAAVLGAARAVDGAVKEAEPVLRKWSLLLQARHDLVGRAATGAGVAASATQVDSGSVARGWALGLADRPHAPLPDLPTLPLSHALSAFYALNGVPVGAEQALAVALVDLADPAIAEPLSRAVVATMYAEAYVANGLVGGTGVDARRFLELDAAAARIAASDGASAEDLALLEEYAASARRIADTPALTAAELLFLAAADLSASSAAAAPKARGPALRLQAADSRLDFPVGGSMTVHNEANGTSVSFDVDGDGRDDFWPPVSTGGVRLGSEAGRCRYVLYQEKNNNDRVDPNEPLVPVSASLCDDESNITLKDPYGYFVVGDVNRTVYDDRLGGEVVNMHGVRTEIGRNEGTYNSSFVGRIVDGVLRATESEQSTDGAAIQSPFGPIPLTFITQIVCGFGGPCFRGIGFQGGGLNAHNDGFNNARRSNFTVNSNHYQFVVWDLGGDDVYRTNAGGTLNWTEPYMMRRLALGDAAGLVALVVDAGEGNDTYAGSRNYTVGSAQLGVALLRDEGGNDAYSGPDDSVASSAGVRRQPPGFAPCDRQRSCGKGQVYGDTGVTQKVGTETVAQDEETPPPEPGRSDFTLEYRKAASAFATILDLEGNDTYRTRDRGLGFANQSFSFLVDLDGRDRYEGREFVQGVANNSGMNATPGPNVCVAPGFAPQSTQGCFPTASVGALVDRAGNDTYVTAGRANMSQGRGIGNASAFGFLPLTVGLLADLAGNDTGIRRNGNVTLGDGLVDVGFRTRHVHTGPRPASDQGDAYPSSGVSLALDVHVPTTLPSNRTFQPKGAYFAAPASHVDMDEDPLFALDLYVDVPRLFVLGTEAATRYEHDAVVLVDLGGGDTYLAPVGAATFDWNATTSHDGRQRGSVQEKPTPEGPEPIQAGSGLNNALSTGCRDFTGDEDRASCTLGTYEHRRVAPVALTLDVAGGDNYTGVLPNGTPVRGFGYGYGGVGALYDLGTAHDSYNVSAVGLGAGELFGVGVLFDAGGDDAYRMVDGKRARLPSSSFGLGFAHAGGVGIAIDAGRLDAPGDDTYQVHNFTLGAVLVDFSREYAVFFDAGGKDAYNATARSVGHAEEIPGPLRARSGEFDGLFNPQFGAQRSFDDVWCYNVQNQPGDAEARFVDDGLAFDHYSPAKALSGVRKDNAEWHVRVGAGVPYYDDAMHPEDCRKGLYFDAGQIPRPSPPEGGADGGAPPVPNLPVRTAVKGTAEAIGIDNLDAYYHRNAVTAMRGDASSPDDLTTADRVPLDEVFAVRAILLSPAAEFRAPGSGFTYASPYAREPPPVFRDTWPVGVVATRGPSSIRTNAVAFAEFLLADTVPRTTCSYVPHPTGTARALSRSDNPDPGDGGRPPVDGAQHIRDVRPLGAEYRQHRRASGEMGYCGEARAARGDGESLAEDPCRVETYENRGQTPYRSASTLVNPDANRGPPSPCRDVVDPNPFVDPLLDGVDRFDVPLAAQGLPVLAEALRLAAEGTEGLAPQVEGLNRVLAEAAVRALRGDLPGARGTLEDGFRVELAAGDQPGNPCDPRNPAPAQQGDDCQDVGRLEFYALQEGTLRFLGSWDNARPVHEAGVNVSVLPLTSDARSNVYVARWKTGETTARAPLWPDGAYDVLVRTVYRENGGFGLGVDPRLYVRPEATAPAFTEAYRRVHDEYGYYPGENWMNVTVDNRPSLLPGLSRFGHFRPGIDAVKTVRLAFSEPVSTDSTVTLVPTGGTDLPRTFVLTESMGAIRCVASTAPRTTQEPSVVRFEMDVSGRRPGAYTLVVRPRDCSHPDGQPGGDGRLWSQWSFEATVVGDPNTPLADVALARDYLNPGDLVPCEDLVRACVDVPLVEDGAADRLESPIDTWFVDVEERLPNGQIRFHPPVVSEEPFVRLRPIHGAVYVLGLRALDEAGNLQTVPTVRELAYDELAPRVETFLLPDTVRPDGVLEASWTIESADPAFPSDAKDVVLEWATGPVPKQGEAVKRVWREVPAGMVDQGLGVARISVRALAEQFPGPDVNASKHENYTRMHFANLTDGHEIEIRARARDVHDNVEGTDPRSGNVSKPFDRSRFDSIAPNLTSGPEMSLLHDQAVVEFELSEPGTATVWYSLAGAPLLYAAPTAQSGNGTTQRVTLKDLSQAADYEFRVVARDLVGNEAQFPACTKENETAEPVCPRFAFTTDRVVTVEVTAPAAGQVVSGPARAQWSAVDYRTDPYVTYQLKLSVDGGKTFPHNLTTAGAKPLYERSAPLRSFVFDSRLYPDSAEAVLRVLANNSRNPGVPLAFDSGVFRIDNAPPRTTALLSGEGVGTWFRTPVTVTLQPSDRANVSLVARVEWSRDNVSFTAVDGLVATVPFEDEGTHTLFFRAADVLGNVEPVRSVSFSIDRTLPEASVLVEGGAASTRSPTVELEIAARDALSSVQGVVVRVSGADPVAVPGERFRGGAFVQGVKLPGGDGEKSFEVVVTDLAGNRNVVRTSIRLDTSPPSFEEFAFDRVAFESASASVRLSEPASLEVSFKRKGDVGFLGRLEYADPAFAHRVLVGGLAPSNAYLFRFVAVDPLGNRAERTLNITTLEDLAAPTQALGLLAADDGRGVVDVSWAPARDNVGIDRYLVLRAPVEGDAPTEFVPAGVAFRARFLDDGVEAGRRYAWKVVAVDAAGNEGPASALAVARATTAPVLVDAGVSPPSGSAAETFTYAVIYRDDDGDAPAFVRITIDGEVYDMTRDRTPSDEGVRYVYRTTLPPTRLSSGVHTFRFEASDGRTVVQFPPPGLDAGVGPAVFGSALEVESTSTLGAAIRAVPGAGALALAAALAVAFMTAGAFRRRRSP